MPSRTDLCPTCGHPLNSRAAGGLCPICIGRISILGSAGPDTEATPVRALPHFGDYELLEEAGRGAMGVVYRARHRGLNRVVALKMILSGPFASAAERHRFEVEACAAAQLDHPNIVPIHEFGEHADRQFYAMRWVEGGALEIGMGEAEAARVIATVARAVHHAHQRGVLHRDLKPGNILLDQAGEPFVSDFGLARRLNENSTVTASGSPVGTPAYMSPEQAAGAKSITTATDVWSLGAVLYHLLAGRPVFQGASTLDVLSKVREGMVAPLRRWNPRVSRDLETICLKCLRVEPSARYASAAEVAEDLERWARHEPIRARPASALDHVRLYGQRRPAVTALSVLAMLLLVAGIGGVISQWRRAERERDRGGQELLRLHIEKAGRAIEAGDPLGTLPWMAATLLAEAPRSPRGASYRHFIANTLRESLLPEEIWFFDHEVRDIAFSADGRWLAASAGPADLLVVQLDRKGHAMGEHRLPAGGKQIAFTPDGRQLFNSSTTETHRGAKLHVFELPALRRLPEIVVRPKMKWVDMSHDGRWLATASDEGVVQIHDTSSGKPACAPLLHGRTVIMVEFNPAGTRLITVCDDSTVHLWDIPAGRELQRIAGETFWRAHFSPDGRQILVVSRREHHAQLYDTESLTAIGPELRHDDYVQDARFSPDGTRIATVGNDHVARIWDARTGRPTTPPLQHGNEVYCLQFSPDGRMLATGGVEPAARVWNVATGQPLTPWLRHAGEILSVKFSPDARHLLTSSRDGTARLWPLEPPHDNQTQLADLMAPVRRTDFSDDGKLAFCCSGDRGRAYRTVDWQPLTPVIKCDGLIDHECFSPDGKHLLIASRDHWVRVWDWDSNQPTASVRHRLETTDAVWLPDSQHIFSTSENGDFTLWDARNGHVQRAFPNEFGLAQSLAASSDGCWVAGGYITRIAVWNVLTGERAWVGPTGHGGLHDLRFSPDSRSLAGGDETGGVRLHRASTGELLIPPLHHGATVRRISFSADGRRFLVVSDNLQGRVWSSATGEPLLPPLRLPGGVANAALSPDGRWLAVGNKKEFQIWDAVSGVPVSCVQPCPDGLSGMAFTLDGRLHGVTAAGRALSFQIADLPWPNERIVQASRLLSGAETDGLGGLNLALPAGSDATPKERRTAEDTWRWLRTNLPAISHPPVPGSPDQARHPAESVEAEHPASLSAPVR